MPIRDHSILAPNRTAPNRFPYPPTWNYECCSTDDIAEIYVGDGIFDTSSDISNLDDIEAPTVRHAHTPVAETTHQHSATDHRNNNGNDCKSVSAKIDTPNGQSPTETKDGLIVDQAVVKDDGGASITNSIFNLANNVAGAGLLTLPAGVVGTGWIPSIGLCLVVAAVSSHTFTLVGKSCALTGKNSFKDLWTYAFGSDKSAWIVDTMVFVQCFFVSVMYAGLIGDIFSDLLQETLGIHQWWTTRTNIICIFVFTILFPLSLIRDLRSLGFTSILGVIAVLYTVVFMMVRAVDGSYGVGSETGRFVAEGLLPEEPSFAKSSLWNVDLTSLVLTSNLALAFMAHYNAPTYWKSLGKSASTKKFSTISKISYLILAIIYMAIMVTGYATFGDVCMGNILLNYSNSDVLAILGRLATGLSIIFGAPLQFHGCQEGFKNAASALDLFLALRNPKNHTLLVLSLLLIATNLAVITKDIALIASLTGAVTGSALVYICPTLLYFKIVERQLGADSMEYQLAKRNLVFIPFGLFTASLGVAMTLIGYFGK
mmetsp:Transcript_6173/g.17582  ORF Transcript_6173/g.17582 Transcript_6173/m.17582 type:complete len:543 (+) Transcript_6173:126-1754(+)